MRANFGYRDVRVVQMRGNEVDPCGKMRRRARILRGSLAYNLDPKSDMTVSNRRTAQESSVPRRLSHCGQQSAC
jgi:hypothetical protein